MTTSHTPGPWIVDDDMVKGSRGDMYPLLFQKIYATEADARLIAAAPDLLAALDSIRGQAEISPDCGEFEFRNRMAEIRAIAYTAIAKATNGRD